MVVIVWWTLVPSRSTLRWNPARPSKRFVRKLANEGASVNVVPMDLRLRPYTTDDETAARRAEDIAAAEDSMFLLGLEPEMTWTEFS